MPQIYVIYRPEDAPKKSKEIIRILEKTYGASNILRPNYEEYVDVYAIERHVQKTDFLLVIIGNYWADMVDESGVNLLHSVYDPVHMAIATAINSRKQIIPILVEGASMPQRARLPRELRKLTAYEPVKLDKSVAISKSLTKGLKDIIKHNNRLNIPDFVPQVKLPQRAPTRQPTPQYNRQYWVKRTILPIIAIAVTVILLFLMITPTPVEAPNLGISDVATTIPDRATATTLTLTSTPSLVPPTAILSSPKITTDNASQLALIQDDTLSISQTELVVFSQDQTLFIFLSSELQEVQVRQITPEKILKIISTSPHDPIAIQLNADETRLLILLSNGQVVAWGIPTE